MMRAHRLVLLAAATAPLVAAGCSAGADEATPVPGGSPERGAHAIAAAGCGSCHQIPGIAGASGMVGPPLDHIALRGMIAGELPNTPENMMLWVLSPQAVEPKTAMPNVHLDPATARDVVAYLYTLH